MRNPYLALDICYVNLSLYFGRIRRFPVIKTLEDNDRFCSFMQDTLDKHRAVIPELAIGCVVAPHTTPCPSAVADTERNAEYPRPRRFIFPRATSTRLWSECYVRVSLDASSQSNILP